MKVKLRTIYASPARTAHPGQVVEVSAEEGAQLVDGGFAEAVKDAAAETTEAPAAENAALRTSTRRNSK